VANKRTQRATAYVTLEPCSHVGRTGPCADVLVEAKVGRVVVAMLDPFKEVAGRGIQKLKDAGIRVDIGLFESEARALNKGFLKRCEKSLPWVQLKLAGSLEGRTALANGESKWITGTLARAEVQEGRAQAGAILTGADTVLADNPQLNVRPLTPKLEALKSIRQPVRVVIDSQGRLTPDLNIFQDGNPVILVRTRALELDFPAHVEELVVSSRHGKVDLQALIKELSERNIHTIWVECGATLAGALLQEQLIDEIIVYVAPKLLGSVARPLIELPDIEHMQHVPELALVQYQVIEQDLKLTYYTNANAPSEEHFE